MDAEERQMLKDIYERVKDADLRALAKAVGEHDRALKGTDGQVGLVAVVKTAAELVTEHGYILKGKEGEIGLVAKHDALEKALKVVRSVLWATVTLFLVSHADQLPMFIEKVIAAFK